MNTMPQDTERALTLREIASVLITDRADVFKPLEGYLAEQCQLTRVTCTEDAASLLLSADWDLVVVPCPFMSERDLWLRERKQWLKDEHSTIWVLLESADESDAAQWSDAGADDVLQPPFSNEPEYLKRRVLHHLKTLQCAKFAQRPNDLIDVAERLNGASFAEALLTRVDQQLHRPELNVGAIARGFHMSERTFRRKVQKELGTSPVSLLLERRIERALWLLSSTSLNVSTIAHNCGFQSATYFSRVFKKRFNQSPGEWRKQQG